MKIGLKKGFTLIELLIVIAIIGILAVALLPTILGAPAKGRDASRKALLSSVMTAVEAANLEMGGYPTGKLCIDNTTFATRLPYFQGGSAPVDPLGGQGAILTGAPAATGCGRGEFLYVSSSGTGGKNYLLVSYVEIPGSANGLWSDVSALPIAAPFLDATLSGPQTVCTAMVAATGVPNAASCIFAMQK